MSEYYDEVFRRSIHYRGPPEKSPYYPLWRIVLDALSSHSRILDAGCGPGQFGELCVKAGHKYVGLDYSNEAIQLAKQKGFGDYIQVDLEKDLSIVDSGDYDTFTAIEFLEHIGRDQVIVAAIPRGKEVVISGPSYLCEGHLRCFSSLPGLRERYGDYLQFGQGAVWSGYNVRRELTQVFVVQGIRI